MNYRQITVERQTGSGIERRTFWTEERHAKMDSIVMLPTDGESPSAWTVTHVYGITKSTSDVVRDRHAWTRQRKASDI